MVKRNYELRCRVSKEEFEKIKKKCNQAGVPVAVFLRHVALKSMIKINLE